MKKTLLICTAIGTLLYGCSDTSSYQSSTSQTSEVTPTQALLSKIPSSYFELAKEPTMKMSSQEEFDREIAQNFHVLNNLWNKAESTNDPAEKNMYLCMSYVPLNMLLVIWIAANPDYAIHNNQYGNPEPYLNAISNGIKSAGGCDN